MKRNRDPLLWAAMKIQRILAGRAEAVFPAYHIGQLLERQHVVQRAYERLRTAQRHGWFMAAEQLRLPLLMQVRILTEEAAKVLACPQEAPVPAPTLPDLLADLRQLKDEFESVQVLPKERKLVAHTDAIELEGLELGPFAIELRFDRLNHSTLGIQCFQCIALEPNPAAHNNSVTHPHVSDRSLCAGDATIPIADAMRQGRIADAFCLIRSVLTTYNPGSPYVAIGDWNGVSCHDCEVSVSAGELNHCQNCGNDVCDDCYSCCDICDNSCCRNCLERDSVSERDCCTDCRQTCSECGRTVDNDSFDDETELCPQCAAKHESDVPATQNPLPENDSDETTQTPEPEPATLAG